MRSVQPPVRSGDVGTGLITCSPRLIAAGPAILLVERWRSELSVLHRRSPSSDAAATLADCLRELIEAINNGDDVTLQLTVADAHAVSRIPLSTLRWLCKHKPTALGARKREGVWYLDRVRFQEFLDSSGAEISAPQKSFLGDAEVESRVARVADVSPGARAG
jgi:hypothetical protein